VVALPVKNQRWASCDLSGRCIFAASQKARRSRSGAKVEISHNDFQGADLSRRLLHGSVANRTQNRRVASGTTS
jgi:hypothetical protein